ncbi:hypothetical protein [Priestia filamentosa]|uniref:hypothetical protein n=1 Tax=Priestia filamentosa TaxID=1402861 RepID=UPI003982504B
MYSYSDLFISFIISIGFVLIFIAQKRFFFGAYFTFLEIVVDHTVTVRKIIIRILMIFIFAGICKAIVHSEPVILLGVLLGSFLIIWPAIVNTEDIFFRSLTSGEKSIAFMMYFFFIAASVSIAKMAFSFYPLFIDFTIEQAVNYIKENFLIILFAIFGYPAQDGTRRVLDRRISTRHSYFEQQAAAEEDNEDEDDDDGRRSN